MVACRAAPEAGANMSGALLTQDPTDAPKTPRTLLPRTLLPSPPNIFTPRPLLVLFASLQRSLALFKTLPLPIGRRDLPQKA